MRSSGAHHVSAELPGAVLFDMDGTITDTERYYIGAFDAMAAERGLTLSGDDGEAVGASVDGSVRLVDRERLRAAVGAHVGAT